MCKTYTWALRRGRRYAKKRSAFVTLCRTCHNLYDQIGVKKRSSRFPGVCFSKAPRLQKRWRATINVNRKQKHLGFFATEEEAARAYSDAVKKILWVK